MRWKKMEEVMLNYYFMSCLLVIFAEGRARNMTAHQDDLITNTTGIGLLVGSKCNSSCNENLQSTICNLKTERCECEEGFSVLLAVDKGCVKPARLGEQCFYSQSCKYYDEYSLCVQEGYNAMCQCSSGYHTSKLHKTSDKGFCSEDILRIATDFPTTLLIICGFTILSSLICFVLKLFVGFRGGRNQNASVATRLLTPNEFAQASRSLRGSQDARTYYRRGSSGVTVSTARACAARAAAIQLLSCHLPHNGPHSVTTGISSGGNSTAPSNQDTPMSYGARQFQRDRENKEAARRNKLQRSSSAEAVQSAKSVRSMQSSTSLDIIQNYPTNYSRSSPNHTTESCGKYKSSMPRRKSSTSMSIK